MDTFNTATNTPASRPVPSSDHQPSPWRLIALVFGSFFLITSGVAAYFWQKTTSIEPSSYSETSALIAEAPLPNQQENEQCPNNFYYHNSGSFALCIPNRFSLNSYSYDDFAGVVAIFKSSSPENTLSIVENFVGGWGPNPCAESESVTFLGQDSQQFWVVEVLSNYDFEAGDNNPPLECGKTLEAFITNPENKWSIGLNAHELGRDTTISGVNREEFSIIRNSFTTKNATK